MELLLIAIGGGLSAAIIAMVIDRLRHGLPDDDEEDNFD